MGPNVQQQGQRQLHLTALIAADLFLVIVAEVLAKLLLRHVETLAELLEAWANVRVVDRLVLEECHDPLAVDDILRRPEQLVRRTVWTAGTDGLAQAQPAVLARGVPHAALGLDRHPWPGGRHVTEAVGQHLPVVRMHEIGKQRPDLALQFLGRMAEDREELLIDPADTRLREVIQIDDIRHGFRNPYAQRFALAHRLFRGFPRGDVACDAQDLTDRPLFADERHPLDLERPELTGGAFRLDLNRSHALSACQCGKSPHKFVAILPGKEVEKGLLAERVCGEARAAQHFRISLEQAARGISYVEQIRTRVKQQLIAFPT